MAAAGSGRSEEAGAEGPTGVLVARAWTEPSDDVCRIRARVTTRLDIESDATESSVAGSIDEVLTRVREWLEAVIAAGERRA
jgi:hypothetical protein